MDFVTAVKTCLGKYATFQGRASRSEYWFFALFTLIVSVIAGIIDAGMGSEMGVVSAVITVALLLPGIAVAVRRLHDTDRSGWWYLIMLIPLVGFILLLVWFCLKGTPGANRFGENPLGGEAVPTVIPG